VIGRNIHPGAKNSQSRELNMKTWRKPQVVEIAVGTEINAYFCAAL
jgi:coenzyme PQQ precursor peptide PqqA